MLDNVQKDVNRYIRERDCFGSDGANCISCTIWKPFEELDAGHYIQATSMHALLRFDERNIHAQCHRCNRYLNANLIGYFRGLEKKLGREALDELEKDDGSKTYTKEECNEIKKYYKQKLADLRRGIPPSPPTKLPVFEMPG